MQAHRVRASVCRGDCWGPVDLLPQVLLQVHTIAGALECRHPLPPQVLGHLLPHHLVLAPQERVESNGRCPRRLRYAVSRLTVEAGPEFKNSPVMLKPYLGFNKTCLRIFTVVSRLGTQRYFSCGQCSNCSKTRSIKRCLSRPSLGFVGGVMNRQQTGHTRTFSTHKSEALYGRRTRSPMDSEAFGSKCGNCQLLCIRLIPPIARGPMCSTRSPRTDGIAPCSELPLPHQRTGVEGTARKGGSPQFPPV